MAHLTIRLTRPQADLILQAICWVEASLGYSEFSECLTARELAVWARASARFAAQVEPGPTPRRASREA